MRRPPNAMPCLTALLLAAVVLGACEHRPLAPLAQRPNLSVQGESVIAMTGDTVYTLSRRYKASVRAVIEANGLRPPYQLYPGQTIFLPKNGEHVVVQGDTASGVAQRYGLALRELARANDLAPPYVIKVGQRLRLPAAAGGVKTAVAEAEPVRPRDEPHPEPKPAVAAAAPAHQAAVTAPAAAPAPAGAALPEPPPLGGGFVWPAKGELVSRFGPLGKGQHNDGINIALSRGAQVRAAADGVVAYAGNELRGFGNLLLIKHANGWVTAYAHNEELLVSRGAVVRRGQAIARAGATGSVRSPQLHFELRKGAQPVDPLQHLPTERALVAAPAA